MNGKCFEEKDILIQLRMEAMRIIGRKEIYKGYYFGSVASALRTKNGNVYSGISLVSHCSLGMCAEKAAVMDMLKYKETEITHIISIYDGDKSLIPPCGACRELLKQTNIKNLKCKVFLENKIIFLSELLPKPWFNKKQFSK